MESITLFVKNKDQVNLLYQFLKHIDFVVFPKVKKKTTSKELKFPKHCIFNSAGLWENRTISQENLREKAWKRS